MGQHNATVKCNDSAGLFGPESTINFTVEAKPILFITDDATPNSQEGLWLSWIDTHSSGEGFSWSYDAAQDSDVISQDSDVISGSVNVSEYQIALMNEYETGIGFDTALSNYQNQGGIVVMIGYSVDNGPEEMGYSTGSSAEKSTLDRKKS
jgi:hypothetical protein